MLITEEYRRLNAQKHEESANFGALGRRLAPHVRDIAKRIGAHTILDYGCGKRTLEKELGYAINNYDPAIPGCDSPPDPADLVICGDVLEHIEPECLEDVLDDLKRLTKNTIVFLIDTHAANVIKLQESGTLRFYGAVIGTSMVRNISLVSGSSVEEVKTKLGAGPLIQKGWFTAEVYSCTIAEGTLP